MANAKKTNNPTCSTHHPKEKRRFREPSKPDYNPSVDLFAPRPSTSEEVNGDEEAIQRLREEGITITENGIELQPGDFIKINSWLPYGRFCREVKFRGNQRQLDQIAEAIGRKIGKIITGRTGENDKSRIRYKVIPELINALEEEGLIKGFEQRKFEGNITFDQLYAHVQELYSRLGIPNIHIPCKGDLQRYVEGDTERLYEKSKAGEFLRWCCRKRGLESIVEKLES